MLPKRERLKINSEFNTTYRLKRSVVCSLFVLYTGRPKRNPEIPTRVGFVTSKKIHKRSTKRNRIKRRLREAYRNARKNNELPDSQNWSTLIFVTRQACLEANYNQIYDAVVSCMKKAAKKFSQQDQKC